jgi:hypothetical protein
MAPPSPVLSPDQINKSYSKGNMMDYCDRCGAEIARTLGYFCIQNPGTKNRFIISTPSYGNNVLEKIYGQFQLMKDMEDVGKMIFYKPEPEIRFENGSTIRVSINNRLIENERCE